MKNKKLYEAPDAEQLCLKMEHSFCESVTAGVGTVTYVEDDYSAIWE